MNVESDQCHLQDWINVRDADAFDALAKRYAGVVFGTCLRITGNHAEAEDATQECFETLASIPEIPKSPIGPWLHRVATNKSLDRVRSEQRRRQREIRYANKSSSVAEPDWNDIHDLVDEAIAALPDKLRIPVVAHFLEGESYTAVAESLGTSRQVATNRVNKGVRMVRKSLQRRGVPVSAASLATMLSAELPAAAAAPAATLAGIGKTALAGTVTQASAGGAAGAAVGTTLIGGLVMTKPAIAGIGVAAAIVCAGAFYTATKYDAAPNVAEQNAVSEQNEPMTAVVESPESAAEIARLNAKLVETQERIRQLELDAASKEVAVAASEGETEEDEAKTTPSFERFRELARNTPEAMMRARAMTDMMYGPFLIDAKLDPETEAAVRALMNDTQIELIATEEYAKKIVDDMTWRDLAEKRDAEMAYLTKQMQPMLNDEANALWQSTLQNADALLLEKSLRAEMGMLSGGLTPEHMETAISVGVNAFLTERYALEESDALFTPSETVHYRRRAIHAIREEMPAYLPEDQMTELENYLTFADNMLDAQLTDAKELEEKR